MSPAKLRAAVFAELNALGFVPAKSLPWPDEKPILRPVKEIAARFMALDALFTWVAYPEESVASERVEKYFERNNLRDWLTADERGIASMPRAVAHSTHV